MTFCYQTRCQEPCYSPCNYRSVYSCRSYDCRSPCDYRDLWCDQDCCPTSRYCYPYSCYTRRYSYGSCYPCYRW